MKLYKIIRFEPYADEPYDSEGAGGDMLSNGRAYSSPDPVWSFLSSFIITLMLISLTAGLLYVDKSAREAAGAYENMETETAVIQLIENLSALRWTVRGIFPYFILFVELFLLLCRLFSIVAKAIL